MNESPIRVPFLLYFSLFLQLVGQLLYAFSNGGPIGSLLFLETSASDNFSYYSDHFLVIFCLSFALFGHFLKKISWPLAPFLYSFFFSTSIFFLHSSFAYSFVFICHGARIALPLAIFFILKKKKGHDIILKIALALTFIGHGSEAIMSHPQFIDYLINTSLELIHFPLSEESSRSILFFIGMSDIVLGIICLMAPNSKCYFIMAFWGGITSLLRVLYHGDIGYSMFLMRSSHFLIPFYLANVENKKKTSLPFFQKVYPYENI